jgi:MoaA/NifB/PqqE/SkfB family radical SAM enzyme
MNIITATKLLKKWFKGKKAPPQEIQIYPTNKCNLKCIFCYQRVADYQQWEELSDEEWFRVIEEICQLGTEEILISGGGEPLCRKNTVIGIMKIAKDYGLNGRIITNGTLFLQRDIERIVKLGWDNITFSIDGIGKTHDFLRGKKCFKKCIKNIRKIEEFKKKSGSKLPSLGINMVLTKYNFNEILKMVKLCKNNGIDFLNIEPVCVNNPSVENIKIDKKIRNLLIKELLPKAKKLAENYGIHHNFDRLISIKLLESTGNVDKILKKRKHKYPCYEPWLWPKIEADGSVWACSTVNLGINIRGKIF